LFDRKICRELFGKSTNLQFFPNIYQNYKEIWTYPYVSIFPKKKLKNKEIFFNVFFLIFRNYILPSKL